MRLILFLPGILLISMLVFYLSAKSPLVAVSDNCNSDIGDSWKKYQNCLKESWEELGLNKPLFYFSLRSHAEPDTLYLIYDKSKREAIDQLLYEYGNWLEIQNYYQSIADLEKQQMQLNLSSGSFSVSQSDGRLRAELIALHRLGNPPEIHRKLQKIQHTIDTTTYLTSLQAPIQALQRRFEDLDKKKSIWKNYIPILSWQGFDNRYHNWISKAIRLDFGKSYRTNLSINEELKERFSVTFTFAIFNAFIIYLLSIPLGLWAARFQLFDRISKNVFFLLASIPGFWLAILLRLIFANPHNPGLKFFPTEYVEGSVFSGETFLSMILPLIVYTYGSLAVLSRITRNSLLEVSQLNFMRTVRAKGISESRAYWRHALPNAILPNISLLVRVFPAIFSGSVIIEDIFNITGLGKYIFTEIGHNNTPAILAVFSIVGFLTLVGYLVSDILSFSADPRINRKESINPE